MNKTYLTDLHVHVGISESGKWVKVPSSKNLTVKNILHTALFQKGLDVVGIIDALSPLVQKDLVDLINEGQLQQLNGGGYSYLNKLTVILGGEVETREETGGFAHSLLFLPTIELLLELTKELSFHIKSIHMSSQNAHMNLQKLYNIAARHKAKIVPAHIFTPFKSIYGNCTDKMSNLFNGELPKLSAVELGLSADSSMANRIVELRSFSYIVNSDAHSLQNIAREFTELEIIGKPSYKTVFDAIEGINGRVKNLYGLNPALGKYYLTKCDKCGKRHDYGIKKCFDCGGRVVQGVNERINEIADLEKECSLSDNNYYIHHYPLHMIPSIGGKTLEKVYQEKFTELEIMYKCNIEEILKKFGDRFYTVINSIRHGKTQIVAGGAGNYGSIIIKKSANQT